MKILIVDDNVDIQDIVKDILLNEGHNVRVASSIDEAVMKTGDFEPDAIMLDTTVDGEDGLRMLQIIKNELPDLSPDIIILKGPTDNVPKDNPLIKVSINKPFKSSDILDALKELIDAEEAPAQVEEKKNHRSFIKMLHRKKTEAELSEEVLEKRGISFGSSYVFFESNSDSLYEIVGLVDPNIYDLMIVTTEKSKAIQERFSYDGIEIVQLSSGSKTGGVSIHELGTLTHKIRGFLDSNKHPMVIFDRFEDIIEVNGINQSLLMVNQLMSGRAGTATFAISVDASTLTDKDRGIFLHDMIEYNKEE